VGRLFAAAMLLLLVLLVVVAFAPGLPNDFVNWDDEDNFQRNPHFRGLGWSQLYWDWTSFKLGVYQPLAWMILGAEYLCWGLDPRGYHLASLVLYALDTVVLFVLTLALLRRCPQGPEHQPPDWTLILAAGCAVALFAVHPLRTEVVVWASCQPYLPCALFGMLAVLAYLQAFPQGAAPRRAWLVGAFGFFTAALLCKAVAVSLPLVLLILDVYPLRRLGGGSGRWFGPAVRTVWWEKVPFLVLSLFVMGLALVGRVQTQHLVPLQPAGLSARLTQACYGIGFYALKTVLPWDITAYYPVPRRVLWYEPRFVVSILGTLGVSVALFLGRRRVPGLLAAWLSYLVILAPNLGLVKIGDQIAADRYSYIAMMGFVAPLAAGLGRMTEARRRSGPAAAGLSAACLGVALLLILLSREQCRIWRSTEVLWTHALRHGAGRSAVVHDNLGFELARQGRLEEAAREYAEALRLNPGFAEVHSNLGRILEGQGRLEEAGREYAEALRLNPGFAMAHNNLGAILERQGRLEEAAREYAEALRLNPDLAEAHNNLGSMLGRQGRLAEARAEFSEALRIMPTYVSAHNNLGVALLLQRQFDRARAEFAEAVRLDRNYADAHLGLGEVLLNQGRLDEARAELSEALRLKPDSAAARNSLELVQQAKDRLNQVGGPFGGVPR
jgi:tetratricopeptide (TPR) repeat protein